MKKLNIYTLIISVILLIAIPSVSAAKLASETFDLKLHKPPFNEFFFSNPAEPDKVYGVEAARGVVFSDIKNNKSTASVAITYKLESPGTLSVYCNSALDLKGNYMMESSGSGLNFSVQISNLTKQGKATLAVADTQYAANTPVFTRVVTTPMKTREYRKLDMTIDVSALVDGQYSGYIIMQFATT